MTHETSGSLPTDEAIESSPVVDSVEAERSGRMRFAMVVLYVEDLQRSVDFYRLLGLGIRDPDPGRPVVSYREGGVQRMILATDEIARVFDPDRTRPAGTGYRHVVEFFVNDDEAVDSVWARVTGGGHRGLSRPGRRNNAYSTLVRDPDDNAVLVTHDPSAAPR